MSAYSPAFRQGYKYVQVLLSCPSLRTNEVLGCVRAAENIKDRRSCASSGLNWFLLEISHHAINAGMLVGRSHFSGLAVILLSLCLIAVA